jgi:transcriptional regulator with XRE-family HTH domain
LARLADLSDTSMSQLERGMHEPSVRVLRAVAEGLGVKASQLIMFAAGLPADEDDDISTEEAIRRDPRFSDAQRRALLGVVKSYVESNET